MSIGDVSGTTNFLYNKDGVVVETDENGGVSRRDASGRVVRNWDGNKLDPCFVARYSEEFRWMGFVNDLSANGIL